MALPADSPVVRTLIVLNKLAFASTIILIPFRLRILLLSRPFPPVWQDYTDYLLFASDIALLITLGSWLVRNWLTKQKISAAPKGITYVLVALTIVAGLSSLSSVDVGLSLYHTLRLVVLLGFYFYILNEVHSLSQLTAPLAIQVGIQGLISIWQAEIQSSVGLQRLGEYLLKPEWNGVSIVLAEGNRFLRAYGLSDHPNILGGCFAFALVILFVAIATQKKASPFYSVVFAIGCVGLFYTFSRSAWLALVFALALCLLLIYRKFERAAFTQAALLLVFAAIVVTPFALHNKDLLTSRLGAEDSFVANPAEQSAIGERAYLMWAGNELFEMHPVTGVGLGAMPSAFRIEFPNFLVSYQPSHFVILESAAETGLVGATVFLILLVAPWFVLWRRRNMPLSSGFIAASGLLLAITIVGFLDYYPWLLVPGRLWLWMGWGLWARFSLMPAKA